jgi:hypothetical protein
MSNETPSIYIAPNSVERGLLQGESLRWNVSQQKWEAESAMPRVSITSLECYGDDCLAGYSVDPSKRFTKLLTNSLGIPEQNYGVKGLATGHCLRSDLTPYGKTAGYHSVFTRHVSGSSTLWMLGYNDVELNGPRVFDQLINTQMTAWLWSMLPMAKAGEDATNACLIDARHTRFTYLNASYIPYTPTPLASCSIGVVCEPGMCVFAKRGRYIVVAVANIRGSTSTFDIQVDGVDLTDVSATIVLPTNSTFSGASSITLQIADGSYPIAADTHGAAVVIYDTGVDAEHSVTINTIGTSTTLLYAGAFTTTNDASTCYIVGQNDPSAYSLQATHPNSSSILNANAFRELQRLQCDRLSNVYGLPIHYIDNNVISPILSTTDGIRWNSLTHSQVANSIHNYMNAN